MTWPTIPDFTSLPGGLVTETELQAVADALDEIGDPWTSYVTTMGNVTLNNGTLTAAYRETGKKIDGWIRLVLGSSTAITGSPTFTLPVPAAAARSVMSSPGYYDSSAASGSAYKGGFAFNNTTTNLLLRDDSSAVLSSTNPFTWATGDEIFVPFSYEAA